METYSLQEQRWGYAPHQCHRWGPKAGDAPQQLVVMCHGVGADGSQMAPIAAVWAEALPHALFLAPDAPEPHDMSPQDPEHPRWQWFSLMDRTPAVLQAGADRALPGLEQLINTTLARYNLPSDAYALAGFSQGAMMVLYAGLRLHPPPRAILAFSGAMLAPKPSEKINHVPVLLVHGEQDDVVLPQRSRETQQILRGAGLPVETLFLPALGHAIDDAGIAAGAQMLRRTFIPEMRDSLAPPG